MFMHTRPFVVAALLSTLPLASIAQTEESVQTDPVGTQATEPVQVESDTGTLSVDLVEVQQIEGQIVMQSENTILADSLIGATVYSETDESIGDINNLIISLDGQVEGVVMGVGGFLGIGEKAVAMEMRNLSLQPQFLQSLSLRWTQSLQRSPHQLSDGREHRLAGRRRMGE